MNTTGQSWIVLNNGVKMPQFGLGVWQTENGEQVINAVKSAVAAGYRAIDTAAAYENEVGVGQGIKECGIAREDCLLLLSCGTATRATTIRCVRLTKPWICLA